MAHYKIILYAFLVNAILGCCLALSAADKELFIMPECNKSSLYCNEVGKVIIWLYTTNPNISGYSEDQAVSLENGEFSYIAKIADLPAMSKKVINKKDYYAIPLAMYVFMIKTPGKHKIIGGKYNIAIDEPVIVNDPWYGSITTYRTKMDKLDASSVNIKTNPLPSAKFDNHFSGAIGNYKVEVVIPKGNIIINEPASALIKIEGNGMIGNDTMPDYQSAFGSGCKLKSVSDKNECFYNGHNLMSQKILECEFIPTEKDCVIGPVEFGFFNPDTQKYIVAKSEPVKVEVKSSTVKRTIIDI